MTTSPEKSVVQEADAVRYIADYAEGAGGMVGPLSGTDIRALRSAADALAEQHRLEAENRSLRERASTLEDAAFHFQTCVTCAQDGEDHCPSGRAFAAFLRGEPLESTK